MNILERISFEAQPITKTFKPFEKWKGSNLKDYEVVLQIVNVGDQIEIGRFVANEPMTSLQYAMKIHLLAKAIKSINGSPIITEEELKNYRETHKTSNDFSSHDFVVIYLKKFSEQVINALYFAYEDLQNEYAAQLVGKPLPDVLKIKPEKPVEKNKPQKDKDVQDEQSLDTTGN